MSEQPEPLPPREAEFARPWRPGDPPMRQHVYPIPQQPQLEVFIDGEWCRAHATMRQESADGRVIYHLAVYLAGHTSPGHRPVVWHPASIRLRDRGPVPGCAGAGRGVAWPVH